MAKKTYESYTAFLQDRLKDPELAMAYLNEALQDEDKNVFLLALKDVLELRQIKLVTENKNGEIFYAYSC